MLDRINEIWDAKSRIGECSPVLRKEVFKDIEEKIVSLCTKQDIEAKFNVGDRIGGIPPKGDRTPIVNPEYNAIKYHDVIGGIWINSRNAEINCRNIDNILHTSLVNDDAVNGVVERIQDKYKLSTTTDTPKEVIFLPGSNIRHIVNTDRVEEILLDFPNSMVKPHPIQTEVGIKNLKEKYKDRLIDKDDSGYQLLNNCSMLWTTYNSEIGLIAALKKIEFGDVMRWERAYECVYSPVYRHFKYRDVKHNYEVVAKIISSKSSGLVFPWQKDWEERVEIAINSISHQWKPGTIYPYKK